MNHTDLIQNMKDALQPGGTSPIVRLFLRDSSYFNKDFIDSCIEELERLPVLITLGEKMTPLQQLALYVLMDSSYIRRD